jgi:hypothetical protein
MARSPIAAAMVGKTLGRAIDEGRLPVYVERFGSNEEEIFVTAEALRRELGPNEFERIPAGALGLFTYYERLAQGLRQHSWPGAGSSGRISSRGRTWRP